MQKIIITESEAKKMITLYNEGMSFHNLAKNSVELLGRKINCMKMSEYFKKNNIPMRSLSDAVSVATLTLDQNVSFLNENLIEAIDGFLLGDGCSSVASKVGRFSLSSSQKEWCDYSMSFLKCYNPTPSKVFGEICEKRPNPIWASATCAHKDIGEMRKRWYPEGVKIVPQDVRITPLSTLLWYLGDGSLSNGQVITLATCSFSNHEIDNILIPKLKEHGIHGSRGYRNVICISTDTSKNFFKLIGEKSPIACYDYKFDLKEMYKMYRISEIAKNQNELWRIQYLCKNNIVDFTKLENGKLFLFNEEQKNKLAKTLNDHFFHEKYSPLKQSQDFRWKKIYGKTHGLLSEKPSKNDIDKIQNYNENLINILFLKYSSKGFPYPKIDNKQDLIKNIKNHEMASNTWDGYGTNLATYFHPHIYKCHHPGKLSPFEFFNNDKLLKNGIFKLTCLKKEIKDSHIREICRNDSSSSRINNFPPRVAKKIYETLSDGKEIDVLDPCHGFSGRLIGAMFCKYVKSYHGIDFSKETHVGAINTKNELLNETNCEIKLDLGDCIEVMKNINQQFDVIFTSPPFFKKEKYVGVDIEGLTWDKWIEQFVNPFGASCFSKIKVGGKCALYLENSLSFKLKEAFTLSLINAGFKLISPIRFKMSNGEYGRSKLSFRMIDIICFQK